MRFFSVLSPLPSSTFFPYTTLFRSLDGIEGVGRFQDARVVMRVVAVKAEPVPKAQLAREIDAAGASEIRIEVRAGANCAFGTGCGIESKADNRSEEHTSELQSRFDIVCRLLLEKKKI